GYEGRLSEAVIDVRKGNVVSDKPVWVKMLDGFLNAKRLDIVERGAVIRFTGVAMTLQPGKRASADATKANDQWCCDARPFLLWQSYSSPRRLLRRGPAHPAAPN